MTTAVNVATIFVAATAAQILERGLEIAKVVGLPVTSWRTGDPTRTVFKFTAEVLAQREDVTAEYVKAGFLSTAEGDWLTIVAKEVYGVDRVEATPASSVVTLANAGGGYYPLEAGDFSVKNTTSGATYTCASSGTLSSGVSVDFDVIADEAGSGGSALEDEIDSLVTALLGVTATASTAATGIDEESDEALRIRCESTLGALSPNGPPDAYEYVALSQELTGVTDVTRAQSSSNAVDGTVTLWLASASGTVAGASVTAVQDAIESWATPLCITPTAVNSAPSTVNVDATVSGEGIPGDVEDQVESSIGALLAAIPIGDVVARSAIISNIHALLLANGASSISVTLTTPASDIDLSDGEVPVQGTTNVTVA